MLFGFRLPLTAPVAYDEIFLVDSSQAKCAMRSAAATRDQLCNLLINMATAPIGSDFKTLLDLVDSYLPMIVAIVEQVHKTSNRKMSDRITFKWSSWLVESRELLEMILLEDELCCIYTLFALVQYKQAHAVLSAKRESNGSSADNQKQAIAHLRAASSIFEWISTTLVPLSLMASEIRPLECSIKSLEALSILCLCNWQEIIIESAIAGNKSHGAIVRLFLGVVDQYGAMQRALNALNASYHSLDTAFKVFPRIRSDYYLSQAYYYLGSEAFDHNNYGNAIALFQESKRIADEIRFPEVNHPSITAAKNERHQFLGILTPRLTNLVKDNTTIYFAVVPDVKSIALPSPVFMPKCDKFEPISADSRAFFVTVFLSFFS